MAGNQELRQLLEAWAPQQRWFSGKGRAIHSFEATRFAHVGSAAIYLVDIEYDGGERETYQVPLVLRTESHDGLEHVLLGTLDEGEGLRWVYDALHDKENTGAWLTGIRDEVVDGPIRFVRTVDPDDIAVDAESLVMSGEQSNTSLVYGQAAILKVFRRLQPGLNPDVEVQAKLTELGATHVARLFGHVVASINGEDTSLAMLQDFMISASDGWQSATASVRDLMAEADLHADEAGGDFAAEAERLGLAVAEVHVDLAGAFGTGSMDAGAWKRRVDVMRSKLDDAIRVVPELAEVADGLHGLFEAAGGAAGELPVQRIHGDLHLGQVLRTFRRWILIDFEGEPMAGIQSRREYDSPLRDVAGMLRSFDYAGHHRLIEELNPTPQLAYRAEEWSQRNRGAFCDGYKQGGGADPAQHATVLRAFEAEKAVYEAVYEARNRPEWLVIPMTSLRALVSPGGTTS